MNRTHSLQWIHVILNVQQCTPPIFIAFHLEVLCESVVERSIVEEPDEFLHKNQQRNCRRDSQVSMKKHSEDVDSTVAVHFAEKRIFYQNTRQQEKWINRDVVDVDERREISLSPLEKFEWSLFEKFDESFIFYCGFEVSRVDVVATHLVKVSVTKNQPESRKKKRWIIIKKIKFEESVKLIGNPPKIVLNPSDNNMLFRRLNLQCKFSFIITKMK